MNYLVNKFTVATGYTHSDEITLIFSPAYDKKDDPSNIKKKTHIYNGRLFKICSLLSGYCSTRFSYHIHKLIMNDKNCYNENVISKINNFETCFDARAFVFPEDKSYDMAIYP